MLFNSINFLIFFPIVVLIYFVIPMKYRWVWLLGASYYFYMSWNAVYAVLMAVTTIVTWGSGLLLEKYEQNKSRKIILAVCIVINLGILGFFKYSNFIINNLNAVFGGLGIEFTLNRFDLLLPVGISFYTFQALGYIIDVYRGETDSEKNLFRYALYVAFFPQLVAGPIERSKNLLRQLKVPTRFSFENLKRGFLLMLWGYFIKLVIADNAAVAVDTVFGDISSYGGCYIALAAVLFAFQIYGDFGGYTMIAIGAAKILGIDLMRNFNSPYFAVSVGDFWRRWHISLSSWFRDYLYIPLGGNRKGKLRKYINLMIVFLVSGLWHGAAWHFVAWGGYKRSVSGYRGMQR